MENTSDENSQPIFDVQKVNLQFDVSANFVAAEVANDVLVLALSTGRILRFDLNSPTEIDDIDLPKRPAEIGVIRRLFLDPSASHLIISTALGENFYLHAQSRHPKALSRLKGVQIQCVAWNPSFPTASTREILLGAGDGAIYETYLEPSTEFYRREERYVKNIYHVKDDGVIGIHVDILPARPDLRRILVATRSKLLHFAGGVGRQGQEGSGSIYQRLFEGENPVVHEPDRTGNTGAIAAFETSPNSPNDSVLSGGDEGKEKAFAWLYEQGVFSGSLLSSQADSFSQGRQLFKSARLFPRTKLPQIQSASGRARTTQPSMTSMTMTQFHVLAFVEGRVIAFNRLDDSVIYNQQILEPSQPVLGLFSDHSKSTYWLFTPTEIFEIVVTDESRSVWKIMLDQGKFEAAQRYATTDEQKDAVAAMTGNHLINQGKFLEAASVLGKSSKPFEDVALTFIDRNEYDALRKYLLTKLAALPKTSAMQRTMLASWLVELYMAKLNQLDDSISAKAEVVEGVNVQDNSKQLPVMRKEYQGFAVKYKSDLDRRTTYEIISSHGREQELLYFAQTIEDYSYVLEYWVQRENWTEAMTVLKRQTEPEMFYRYSTVLMTHTPVELTEVLMRQTNLDPKKLIPALLNYNKVLGSSLPLGQNQAIRYLLFCITQHSTEPALHNTLISLYASNPATDEAPLLSYLETQSEAKESNYDADFALRLCIAHKRVRSAVHVYCAMSQYASAVDLALKHDEIELAADVAEHSGSDKVLKKKLWLKVAKKVIGQTKGIKSAMEFLKKCDLLRIEDLIPFFPDFVVIDDFKEEICAALETYSREIDSLKAQMDASAATATSIKTSISELSSRYAIVEPGERCWKCRLPLLMRQFFVFPCQHSFHTDCLGDLVLKAVGMTQAKRIRELQREVGRAVVGGHRREGMVQELDAMVAGACVLCSEMAVKTIDEPFITDNDDVDEWAI
ncbi:hypothetical protein AMS68_004102 [Peltaster fructicola]|uniref:Uncharacterized protein n=1 Tax=Peltaster fructicola TaxID=286661 RepID=A0A6H0XVA1_9PEZI|nr:hypothetical protein AMS68_004102 [Peltaster fructicola]